MVLALLPVLPVLLVGVFRWERSPVRQGGSFVVRVDGAAEPATGGYLGLVLSSGRAENLGDVWTVLTSDRRDLGPLEPASPENVRPFPGDETTPMGSSLVAAWIAANKLTGVEVPFVKEKVVDQRQEVDLEELGIEAGAPVVADDDGIRVFVDGEVVDVPAEEGVHVLTAYRALLGQPGITVGARNRGASAGLVFGLAYLDHLTAGDLSGGLTVAATGVLHPSGFVHGIAYVFEKTQAALAGGADVIFIPRSNWLESGDELLELIDGSAELVPVAGLSDAVQWLCGHGGVAEGVCPGA